MASQIDQAAICNDGLQVGGDRQRRPANRIGMGHHPLPGGASAKQAKAHVDAEYDRWHARAIHAPSPVERAFIEAVGKVKALAAGTPKRGKRRAG